MHAACEAGYGYPVSSDGLGNPCDQEVASGGAEEYTKGCVHDAVKEANMKESVFGA